ncbi:hypothetical protein HanIR_Chr09g0401001 [Helianthus annuus]|nr:hypothetical protein HanIR_Chr09g0401001 [Helianthus annuus]
MCLTRSSYVPFLPPVELTNALKIGWTLYGNKCNAWQNMAMENPPSTSDFWLTFTNSVNPVFLGTHTVKFWHGPFPSLVMFHSFPMMSLIGKKKKKKDNHATLVFMKITAGECSNQNYKFFTFLFA